jgi:hypothetical protein
MNGLAVGVGIAIEAKTRCQTPLQFGVMGAQPRILAQRVAELQVALPVKPVELDDMHMVRAHSAHDPLEEPAIGQDALVFRDVFIAVDAEPVVVQFEVGQGADADEDVDDRLRGEAGHRCAADVLDVRSEVTESNPDELSFDAETGRPGGVVRHDGDRVVHWHSPGCLGQQRAPGGSSGRSLLRD